MARCITDSEARLLTALLERSGAAGDFVSRLARITVDDLNDGGMGGIRINLAEAESDTTVRKAAALQFKDADGVLVVASLLTRGDGTPLEIDMLKMNSSPLVSIPGSEKFSDVELVDL